MKDSKVEFYTASWHCGKATYNLWQHDDGKVIINIIRGMDEPIETLEVESIDKGTDIIMTMIEGNEEVEGWLKNDE